MKRVTLSPHPRVVSDSGQGENTDLMSPLDDHDPITLMTKNLPMRGLS
jgi:hypothetical protein